jgi:predicted  nucleic acid-binding Zn-ribbon protein
VVEIRNSGSIVLCDACKRVLYQPADEDGEE